MGREDDKDAVIYYINICYERNNTIPIKYLSSCLTRTGQPLLSIPVKTEPIYLDAISQKVTIFMAICCSGASSLI